MSTHPFIWFDEMFFEVSAVIRRLIVSDTGAVSVGFFVHGFKISRRTSQAQCESL